MTATLLLFILIGGIAENIVEGSFDNHGTEFIIGFMENFGTNYDIEIFITTKRTNTVIVKVTAPRFTGFTVDDSFTITSPNVKQLQYNPSIRMTGTNKGSNAIYITATDEIVVVGVNKEKHSTDGFLGLPTDVLGKEYYVVTYYPPTRVCEFLVIGVSDSTNVEITFGQELGSNRVSWSGSSYGSGQTVTESLDRFDTMQIQSAYDMTGSRVVGDKPIVVFSGNRKTKIGSGNSQDHLVEMLMSIDYWGKSFLMIPIPKRTVGDVYKFIASETNTRVELTGDCSSTFTLSNAGSVKTKTIPSTSYCKAEADKAIMVIQFVQSQQSSQEPSDPSMMIIPAIEQYGADYTFTTPKYSGGSYDNHFMFIVKEVDKDGLQLDGSSLTYLTFNKIPGTEYVGGYFYVSEGTHRVSHSSPIKVFGGYLYGNATYETYAFPTGMRLAPINIACVPTPMVIGDGLDNDCDNLIDEEICSPGGTDDDGDGDVDEDCVDIDECAPKPCQNDGTCVDGIASYSCLCAPGWTDTDCTTNIDECSSNPCQNNGNCIDEVNGYTCSCAPGYDGTHCSNNIDECASNPCQHGRCVDGVNGYTCICDPGYTDANCQTDINDCLNVVCQNGGTCHDAVNAYSCQCAAGFTGTHCETNINECSSNPCQHMGTCVDGINRYTCDCVPGYTDTHCNTNINECASSPCRNGGTCRDDVNGYSCYCAPGYTDTVCSTDINECSSAPCENNATCIDKVNKYECSCSPGFTDTNCDINIDECASSPCQHGLCVDRINGYICNCDPGYTDVHCQTDIDECVGVVCQNGGTCVDGINMYTCRCDAGFTGRHCETNINECASGPCQHGGTCNDAVNMYTCSCVPGYTDVHCSTNIDECASSPCQNSGTCNDAVNGYTCDCVPGYTDTVCSMDINECDSSPCENNATCNDRINKYDCSCAAGFTGTNCETNIDECASSPCDTAATCVDGINEFTCLCQPGYMGKLCNESINECDSNPCQNGGECTDKENAYECSCPADFSGDNCETAASSSVAAIAGGVAGAAAATGLAVGAGRLLKKKFFPDNSGQSSGPSTVGPTSEEVLCTAPPPSISMPRTAWK